MYNGHDPGSQNENPGRNQAQASMNEAMAELEWVRITLEE